MKIKVLFWTAYGSWWMAIAAYAFEWFRRY
jgi:hypothetical protein